MFNYYKVLFNEANRSAPGARQYQQALIDLGYSNTHYSYLRVREGDGAGWLNKPFNQRNVNVFVPFDSEFFRYMKLIPIPTGEYYRATNDVRQADEVAGQEINQLVFDDDTLTFRPPDQQAIIQEGFDEIFAEVESMAFELRRFRPDPHGFSF